MTSKNINALSKEYKRKIFNFDGSKDLIEIYYNEKYENPIPLENVLWVKVNENMFSLLPTLEIQIEDAGNLFTRYNIKQGGIIYLIITPNNEAFKENAAYVNSMFVIQSIITRAQPGKPNFTHILKCTYNAQNFLNEYISYPPNDGLTNVVKNLIKLPTKELSSEVIENVLKKSSLKFLEDFNESELHDSCVWINANQPRYKFIDKIVNHAWTENGDSPILFTDRNGYCHYTSLNNLTKKEIKIHVYNTKLFQQISRPDNDKKLLLTNEFIFINSNGTNFNENGYKLEQFSYDPIIFDHFSLKDIFNTDFKTNNKLNYNNPRSKNITSLSINHFVTNNTDSKLSSQLNKTPTSVNNLSLKYDAGMHFNHTHNYYDVAPKHNENVRKTFFNIFVKFAVDSKFFDMDYNNKKLRPELGDIIYLDFSYGENESDKIHTGKYMVVGINNAWIKNGSYTLSYQCVSDGYYGDVKKEEL